MNTTTLFDLNKTASAAAITAIGQDALGTENIKLEAFTVAGHDRADFPQWDAFFQERLKVYAQRKATLSPAAKAAASAAASAAAMEARASAPKTAPTPSTSSGQTATNANTTQASASAPAAA